LTRQLEEPALYTTPEGVSKSAELGKELDSVKGKLEAALQAWTEAVEMAETAS
jgi:hypothetical protein